MTLDWIAGPVEVAHPSVSRLRRSVKRPDDDCVQIHEQQVAFDVWTERLHLRPPARPAMLQGDGLLSSDTLFVRQADRLCTWQPLADLPVQPAWTCAGLNPLPVRRTVATRTHITSRFDAPPAGSRN